MNLSSFFALRYLKSKKSHSVINIIARVSSFAVGIPVAAMIILLSVFNGFEGLVKSMYQEFDPDIAIMPAAGKVMSADTLDFGSLASIDGVMAISRVLEDNVLFEYRGRQAVGMLRGVDSLYTEVVPIEGMVTAGKYDLRFGDMDQALLGQGMAYNLGIQLALYDRVSIIVPRRGATFSSLLPVESYRRDDLFPSGVFMLDADTDGKYVIAPIDFVQQLLDYPDGVSSLMIRVDPRRDAADVAQAISDRLGDQYQVLTRYQQKASLYRIMTYEKWGIFVIILMVLIIASFSIIGSLVMLIIDKRNDIRTIVSMGGDIDLVRKIFVKEGMLISTIGALCGMAFGLVLCWLQMAFGIIKIPAQTFLVDSYPVIVKAGDVAAVALSFIVVNFIITTFTVRTMIPRRYLRI